MGGDGILSVPQRAQLFGESSPEPPNVGILVAMGSFEG